MNNAPALTFDIKDSPYNTAGWREIGQEFTTLSPVEYPRDPAVTRAIKVFDPGMIPLWCRWVFHSPSDDGRPVEVVFGRHAIGRYRPFSGNACFGSGPGQLPNVLELILEGDPDPRASDLPGAFVPWDWSLVAFLRAAYTEANAKDRIEKFVRHPVAKQAARRDALRQEREEINADLRAFADRQLERAKVSESDARQQLADRRYKRAQVKPYIVLGGLPAKG